MAANVEEPTYEVLVTYGQVEIRRYGPVIQAATSTEERTFGSSGFRRLAGYIFGGNEANKSISMTAPVQESLGSQSEMAFTLPSALEWQALPSPKDERVSLRQVPERTVAVIKFGGWARDGRVDRYRRKLLKTLNEKAIEITGEAYLNQYNPPWELIGRRNEVAMPVAWRTGEAVH